MLEFLKSADDVIAIRISGKLADAQLADLIDRIEGSLEAREKTHMFMEVESFSGFDLDDFARALPRGMAMLGKLGRFGRIAVVADQQWIRAWTRIESALLPGISYEVYSSDEREEALAWVEGRRDRPHRPSLKIIETDKADVFGFELDGELTAQELHDATAYFDQVFERPGPVSLLGRIRRIGGVDPAVFLNGKYFQMKLKALGKTERYAIVGGPAWLRAWVAALDPIMKPELRHFGADDEALAWAWLGAEPKSERALAA